MILSWIIKILYDIVASESQEGMGSSLPLMCMAWVTMVKSLNFLVL